MLNRREVPPHPSLLPKGRGGSCGPLREGRVSGGCGSVLSPIALACERDNVEMQARLGVPAGRETE